MFEDHWQSRVQHRTDQLEIIFWRGAKGQKTPLMVAPQINHAINKATDLSYFVEKAGQLFALVLQQGSNQQIGDFRGQAANYSSLLDVRRHRARFPFSHHRFIQFLKLRQNGRKHFKIDAVSYTHLTLPTSDLV